MIGVIFTSEIFKGTAYAENTRINRILVIQKLKGYLRLLMGFSNV